MTTLSPTEFFSRVWPTRLIRNERLELRALDRKKDKIKREFFESVPEFLRGAQDHKDKDVYFGVSTRYGQSQGKKSDCLRASALWVDFDQSTVDQCCNLNPQPNILVGSGKGCHAYWLLSTSLVLRDYERIKHFEAINRGLCYKFNGDKTAVDITRILRIPGFFNYKYTPPVRIENAILLHEERYKLEYFKKHGIYIERKDEDNGEVIEEGRIIKDIPDRIKKQLEVTGGEGYSGDNSRQDSAVITALLNHGLSPEDAYATFSASKRGEDAQERKEGHYEDYMMRTIRKAASYIHKSASKNGYHPTIEPPKPNGKFVVDFGKRLPHYDIQDGIITHKASEIEVESVHWLWPGYLPAGRITILAGNPGEGKSTIAVDLASRISRGHTLPFGKRGVSGNCIIASAEDAAQDTIVPRLIACEANLKKVHVMRHVMVDGERKYISFPRDLDAIRDMAIKTGARLIVIDPFSAFLTKETDSYKDQDIRSVLAPVEDIAEETQAAVLIIAHYTKKEDASPLSKVGGSIAFTGAARSVMAVEQLPNKSSRVLCSIKSNLAKKPPALEYETVSINKLRNGSGQWMGEERIKSSKIRWLAEVDFDPRDGAMGQSAAEIEVRDFLKQIIFDSPVASEQIFKEAKIAGISRTELIRMRRLVGVKAEKEDSTGRWIWSWPDETLS
jgi:archaellum biogenesis ATPase FlaH